MKHPFPKQSYASQSARMKARTYNTWQWHYLHHWFFCKSQFQCHSVVRK